MNTKECAAISYCPNFTAYTSSPQLKIAEWMDPSAALAIRKIQEQERLQQRKYIFI
jgi:hypothetical protein